MALQLIKTEDGSNSLLNKELNESYHSLNGALTESKHVFIKHGLDFFHKSFPEQKAINIFEVGIGTGLNAILAFKYAMEHEVSISYTGVESDPIPQNQIDLLKYKDLEEITEFENFINDFHGSKWDEEISINHLFRMLKMNSDFKLADLNSEFYNVVFYDAFAPNKQPEMWNIELLAKMYNSLSSGGVLTTYCAQGQFKRDLKSCGFEVKNPQGPPGKKEMTVALKI